MKEHQIKIMNSEGLEFARIGCQDQESILEAFIRHDIPYRNECSGRGTCGKCRIQIMDGELKISPSDRKHFTQAQLLEGHRLACKAYPNEDSAIVVNSYETDSFEVITEHVNDKVGQNGKLNIDLTIDVRGSKALRHKEYSIAVDIGTTTLAFALIDINNKVVVRYHSLINSQRVYGLDVISRIKASNEGKREHLKDLIRKDLLEGIADLISEDSNDSIRIHDIGIVGNTTMLHLLMGYSCEKLGVFPFETDILGRIGLDFHELFPVRDGLASQTSLNISLKFHEVIKHGNIRVCIIPGISTFVGGDILLGLYACDFANTMEPCLFIDIGTNGEMAIGNKERILVTSTAAGPAFEGGNITCGTGSIGGAISCVAIDQGILRYETIGGKAPIGICGTGVIEVASELLKEGLMDETGLLASPYFEDGFTLAKEATKESPNHRIYITQSDIRQLQLAKGAVRAGIEQLVLSYRITYDEIKTVYLAGGFGFKLDTDKAMEIGLIPEDFRGKVIPAGNTSLAGAIKYLMNPESKKETEVILSAAKEIHLADTPDFQELFIQSMNFPSEDQF